MLSEKLLAQFFYNSQAMNKKVNGMDYFDINRRIEQIVVHKIFAIIKIRQ